MLLQQCLGFVYFYFFFCKARPNMNSFMTHNEQYELIHDHSCMLPHVVFNCQQKLNKLYVQSGKHIYS